MNTLDNSSKWNLQLQFMRSWFSATPDDFFPFKPELRLANGTTIITLSGRSFSCGCVSCVLFPNTAQVRLQLIMRIDNCTIFQQWLRNKTSLLLCVPLFAFSLLSNKYEVHVRLQLLLKFTYSHHDIIIWTTYRWTNRTSFSSVLN